jgi:hypothetical protein
MLGRLAFVGFREYRLLARRLGDDERIEAMMLGRLKGSGPVASQRIVVATAERLLLVEKGFLTGRERVREIGWDAVEGVEVMPPSGLDLVLASERVQLTLVQPPDQVAAVAELVRRRLDPARERCIGYGELRDLARRKLGRVLGLSVEPQLLALAGELEPEESVLELATGVPGLVVATSRRLLVLPASGIRVGEPESRPYGALRSAAPMRETRGLVVSGEDGERRLEGLLPEGSADSLLQVIQARLALDP